jgi:DNA-binding MarR family transcriptional regulator
MLTGEQHTSPVNQVNMDDLCDTLSHRLLQVSRAHRLAAERKLATLGLHAGQEFVLAALWEKDGLRPKDIAGQLQITAPAVTKLVGRLVAAGLVKQRPSSTDGRSTALYLTEHGHALRVDVAAAISDVQHRMLEGFSDAEQRSLDAMLVRIANNLSDGSRPAASTV